MTKKLPTPAELTLSMKLQDGWVVENCEHREIPDAQKPSGKKKCIFVKLKNLDGRETKWMQKSTATKKYGVQSKKIVGRHTKETLSKQVSKLTNGNAELIKWELDGGCVNNAEIRYKHCGCIVQKRVAPSTLSPDCPICSGKWKTENEVCKLVEEYAPKLSDKDVIISTNRQKTVHMHPNGEPVTRRFDIVIEITHRDDESVKRWVAVEYNGEQHYRPVNFGNLTEEELEEAFKGNKIRDKQKADFCKHFNIPLIIIPYWEKHNIEEIVKTKVRDAIWEQSFDVAFMHFQKNNT